MGSFRTIWLEARCSEVCLLGRPLNWLAPIWRKAVIQFADVTGSNRCIGEVALGRLLQAGCSLPAHQEE